MFETYKINYELDGGYFTTYSSKEELKYVFLKDFYNFVCYHNKHTAKTIAFKDFVNMKPADAARVEIGNHMIAHYFIEKNTPKSNQTDKSFIGYCLINGLYSNLIGHLEAFFYRWRDIEEVDDQTKIHAINFYYFPWASLVDSIKYFNYNKPQDIIDAHDSMLCAIDKDILLLLKQFPDEVVNIPYKTNRHVDVILPIPEKVGYIFEGWYLNGEKVLKIEKTTKEEVTVYAKWIKN